jgi:prepilin-type processing-associated H-X9-DG protein
LVELLVTVSVIGILASLLLAALGPAKARVTGIQCVSNLKQLQLCWQMYAGDHNDAVPPNRSVQVRGVWRSSPDSWIGSSSALFDTDTRAIEQGLLFKYDYNRAVALYRCPADRSRVRKPPGAPAGPLRTRSYSMSGCLGGNDLTNTIQRAAQIPDPAALFVFIDEHEESIDDAHFLVWPYPDDRWVNLPAARHGQSCALSFADGHAERWKWRAPKSFSGRTSYWKANSGPGDLEDLRRLQAGCLVAVLGKP